MKYTADARTNATGHTISGCESDFGQVLPGLSAWDLRERRTVSTDSIYKRIEIPLVRALDMETLPSDASICARFILEQGGKPLDNVTVYIYQKYTIDRKTKLRRPTSQRRSVLIHFGERYQSIDGHIFIGEPVFKRIFGAIH